MILPLVSYRIVRERGPEYDGRRAVHEPADIARLATAIIGDCAEERLLAIALDARNRPTAASVVSVGTATACLVHPREVFAFALREGAVSLAVAHNHPSGDVTPSPEDHATTKRLADAGRLLGVPLLDSLVVSDGGEWASIRDRC